MSTENIVINIREDGSRDVVRNIQGIAGASKAAKSSVDLLRSALGGLTGVLAISTIAKYADVWTRATGKINIFTTSAEETTAVMEQLYKIAQDTRQPIDGVASSFHQLSIAGSALGASQQELLTFTRAIGNALAIQGTDAITAKGGIIQLGQAMNEGIVRAQEYNSMINAMPIVLKTVANNLDGVDGSLAKLRKRMLEGKLYSKDFFEALLKGAPELAALFDRSGKTIGQSITVIQNAFTKLIGEMDQQYGVSAKIYDMAKLVADNIDIVAKSLLAIASPVIIAGLMSVANALWAMALAAAANPYVTLAAAITVAASALYLFRDEIILLEKEQVSLGDFGGAAWDMIAERAGNAIDYIATELPNALEAAMGNITGFQVDFSGMWDDLSGVLKATLNTWIGWFTGLPKVFITLWGVIPNALYNIFATAFNNIKSLVANNINTIASMINPILEKANIGAFEPVQFEATQTKLVKSWSDMATEMGGIMKEQVSTDYLGNIGAELSARAKEIAKARQEAAKAGGGVDLTQPLGSGEDFASGGRGRRGGTTGERMREREQEQLMKSLRTETEQIEAEYKKRNELIVKYTSEGSSQRAELQKRSDEERTTSIRELEEQMTGVYATESQKLEQVYRQRTDMIMRNTQAGSEAQQIMLDKLKEQRNKDQAEIAASEQAKIDSLYSGLLSEEEQILQSYERRKQMILDATNITETQRADLIKRSEAQLIKDQNEMELQRTSMLLTSASGLFDAMAGLAEAAGGKQTAAYRTMFAISKSFAMADASLRLYSAISQAMADPTALTPAQKFANYGVIAASMGQLISSLSSVAFVGQAHDGIDNVPETGTWNLQKGERVIDRRTNGDLKEYLANGSQGGSGGNVVQIGVTVVNNAGEQVAVNVQQGTDENGNADITVMIDQLESSLAQRVGAGRGPLHKSIGSAFGMRSKPQA